MKLAELHEKIKMSRMNNETADVKIEPDSDVDSPSEEIARRAELKATRMNPNNPEFDDEGNDIGDDSGEEVEKKVIKSQYGTRPGDPSSGIGGEDHGAGLMS